jgi:hypothetical protein
LCVHAADFAIKTSTCDGSRRAGSIPAQVSNFIHDNKELQVTLEQTKMALVWSQLPVNAGEVEIELTNALAYLVASGQVDVFIDDSDGEIKFQYIPEG